MKGRFMRSLWLLAFLFVLSSLGSSLRAADEVPEADPLALRVEALEARLHELEKGAPESRRFRWSAFADLAWLVEDPNDFGRTRWAGGGAARFELAQLSLALDGELATGLRFHGQFDWDPSRDVDGEALAVNEAYLTHMDEGRSVEVKAGAYALPFSQEHNGPFRTCLYTITPSPINSFFESTRLQGLEFGPAGGAVDGRLNWRVGIGSGADGLTMYGRTPIYTDVPVRIGGLEDDGGLARYVTLSYRARQRGNRGRFDWHCAWFDNGGDPGAAPKHTPSDETKLWFFGGQWWWSERLVLVGKWCEGLSRHTADTYADFALKYALLRWRIGERQVLSARRDAWQINDQTGGTMDSGEGYTFAWGRRIDEKREFFVELIHPRPGGVQKPLDQDLFQVRYRLRF